MLRRKTNFQNIFSIVWVDKSMTMTAEDIHPMRFLRRFPMGQNIARREATNCQGVLLSSESFGRITNEVMEVYNRDVTRLPHEQRPENMDVAVETISTLSHITVFLASGRNIFEIPAILTSMLAKTSLADIRLTDMNLPFKSFYISFEGNLNVGLPGVSNFIDGVYVTQTSSSISFYLTSKKDKTTRSSKAEWIKNSEPHFFAPLDTNNSDETLEQLLNQALAKNKIELVPDYQQINELISATEDLVSDGYQISNPKVTGYESAARFNEAAMPTVKDVLVLVGNILCFLSTKPDIIEKWSTDAPQNRVKLAKETTTKKRRRTALGQLAEQGFFPIKQINYNVGNAESGQQPNLSTWAEVATHWRRGHWRRQPYGEGREKTRLSWIKPTLVRADKGEPIHGHFYDVATPISLSTK